MRLTTTILSIAFSLGIASGQTCSTRTMRGTHSVLCAGFMSPAAGAPQVPFSLLAIITADGTGGITGAGKAGLGGVIVDTTVSGTATVNADCTGSVTYAQKINGQPGPPLTFAFHLLDNGAEARGMSVDPGNTLTCNLRLISR